MAARVERPDLDRFLFEPNDFVATERIRELGIFRVARTEIGQIIVADVNRERVDGLVRPDADALVALIRKPAPQPA